MRKKTRSTFETLSPKRAPCGLRVVKAERAVRQRERGYSLLRIIYIRIYSKPQPV